MDENYIAFKVSEFKKVNNPKAYMFEVFKDFGFTEWNDMVDLLDAETGKLVFSKTHRLIKNRDHLLLTAISDDRDEAVLIFENVTKKETPAGILSFNVVDAISKSENKKNTIFVDADRLKFPLKLRQKEEGDIFYPKGMKGKKKLSKYYKDEKLSLLDKENTWLLCSGNDIVWVINRRADERFKVEENTKQILKIKLA